MKIFRGLRTPTVSGASAALAAALLLTAAVAVGGQPQTPLASAGAPAADHGCGPPAHVDVPVTVSYSNGSVTAPDVNVPFCTIAKITLQSADPGSYQVSRVHGCDANWPVKSASSPPGHVVIVDANVGQASRGNWYYQVTVTDKQGDHLSAPCKGDPWIHNG